MNDPVWLQQLAADIAGADATEFWAWTGAAIVAAIGCFAFAFLVLHRARLIENTPTSRIRSAAQGYVELRGFARLLPGPPILSPLSGARCCWWKYSVQKQETQWRNGRRTTRWRTVASGTSDELFMLADETGDCVVDPEGADIHPSLKRQWRGTSPRPGFIPDKTPWLQLGDYRYSEQLLGIGDPLYAIGWFRTQAAQRDLNVAADVTALLREWKADRTSLLARFDADGDGHIDLQEWETARRAALEQVRKEHLEHALSPDIHVLCRPGDRRPYILSTLSQEQLARRYRISGGSLLLLSIAIGVAAVFSLTARGML